MKFTEQGQINLTIAAVEKGGGETWSFQFSVRDTARAFPWTDRSHI